ncbi:MAG: hypothetical protein M3209_02705 [Acidobacteriota bacterium]|nr:hypothetical protein [Acidobacteriota bacterium]
MGKELLEKRFGQMGARIKIKEGFSGLSKRSVIDIRKDKDGEFFDIKMNVNDAVDYEVVDLRPDLRHLLLMERRGTSKNKFLCGHDERHWFVCAVPGNNVSSVETAMEALQPADVRSEINRKLKRRKNRFTRRNEVFVRQGEWFFVPVEGLKVNPHLIFRNEPINRGRGQSHYCEEVCREGGETVMVCRHRGTGVTIKEYNRLLKTKPHAAGWDWRPMRHNAAVYARGRVRHPDHKTIVLDGWHRILMNTENEAPGMNSVVFLD